MSTLVAQTISNGINSTSITNLVRGPCVAWVNFNGVVVGIRGSYNVSSVVRNTTGNFTLNLTNALVDTNGAIVTAGMRYAASESRAGKIDANMTNTTTVRLFTGYEDSYSGPIPTDLEFNFVAIIR